MKLKVPGPDAVFFGVIFAILGVFVLFMEEIAFARPGLAIGPVFRKEHVGARETLTGGQGGAFEVVTVEPEHFWLGIRFGRFDVLGAVPKEVYDGARLGQEVALPVWLGRVTGVAF